MIEQETPQDRSLDIDDAHVELTSSSAVIEATLNATYEATEGEAAAPFSGGYVVNVFAQPGDVPLEYESCVSWGIRTSPS